MEMGRWCEGKTIDVLNPYNGQKITAIAEATAADVDLAVEAAQRAFPKWAKMAAHERAR